VAKTKAIGVDDSVAGRFVATAILIAMAAVNCAIRCRQPSDSSQFTYGALLPFELLLVVPLEFSSVVVFEVSVELSIDRCWIVPVRSAGSF
jgi:hypothetical protein